MLVDNICRHFVLLGSTFSTIVILPLHCYITCLYSTIYSWILWSDWHLNSLGNRSVNKLWATWALRFVNIQKTTGPDLKLRAIGSRASFNVYPCTVSKAWFRDILKPKDINNSWIKTRTLAPQHAVTFIKGKTSV